MLLFDFDLIKKKKKNNEKMNTIDSKIELFDKV